MSLRTMKSNHSRPRRLGYPARFLLLVLGWSSLLVGFLGIFLPLLPTTPFVLLSAACFSRSSENVHRWLLHSHLFGELIRDWEANRMIRTRVKLLATVLMVSLVSYPLLMLPFARTLKILAALSCLCVLIFIWSRPSSPAS